MQIKRSLMLAPEIASDRTADLLGFYFRKTWGNRSSNWIYYQATEIMASQVETEGGRKGRRRVREKDRRKGRDGEECERAATEWGWKEWDGEREPWGRGKDKGKAEEVVAPTSKVKEESAYEFANSSHYRTGAHCYVTMHTAACNMSAPGPAMWNIKQHHDAQHVHTHTHTRANKQHSPSDEHTIVNLIIFNWGVPQFKVAHCNAQSITYCLIAKPLLWEPGLKTNNCEGFELVIRTSEWGFQKGIWICVFLEWPLSMVLVGFFYVLCLICSTVDNLTWRLDFQVRLDLEWWDCCR